MSRKRRFASASPSQGQADEAQGARGEPRRVRMDRKIVPVGEPVHADEVDGIALEGVVAPHIDAVVVDDEIVALQRAAPAAAKVPSTRSSIGRRLAWRASSSAQTIAVRSPTSFAMRK
jgi:hypothetical protein